MLIWTMLTHFLGVVSSVNLNCLQTLTQATKNSSNAATWPIKAKD